MKHAKLLPGLVACFISLKAFCWGSEGHQTVGKVAYHYLNPSVKDSLKFYLDTVTLARAGLWMDEMRKFHEYDYMKPWHYINIPKGQDYKPDTGQNVINEIRKRIDHLKHRNIYTKQQVAVDIKILVHLVEDLHMPLHAGYPTDTGGNAVHLTFMGNPTTLHWAWDNDIMLQQHITADTCLSLLAALPQKQLKEMRQTNIVLWMKESRGYLPQVYDFKGTELDEAYANKNAPIIKMRLSLAGLRLAELLNELFR